MLEVELKAALDQTGTAQRLLALGFTFSQRVEERDTYYLGIDRDFAQTDEALRLRRARVLPAGREETRITYKGPKAPGVVKSRTEHETAVEDGQVMAQLLEALGYRPLRQVEKVREMYVRGDVTACLDMVTGLGPFLELEILTEADREAAAAVLLDLLDQLEIPRESLRRQSYLGMLLAGHNGQGGTEGRA